MYVYVCKPAHLRSPFATTDVQPMVGICDSVSGIGRERKKECGKTGVGANGDDGTVWYETSIPTKVVCAVCKCSVYGRSPALAVRDVHT